MGFIDEIKARAKADKRVIVLPETEDERTYKAAQTVLREADCRFDSRRKRRRNREK